MKIFVIFDFPEISNANSEDADNVLQGLTMDLTQLHTEWYEWSDYKMNWYIDDAVGENKNG